MFACNSLAGRLQLQIQIGVNVEKRDKKFNLTEKNDVSLVNWRYYIPKCNIVMLLVVPTVLLVPVLLLPMLLLPMSLVPMLLPMSLVPICVVGTDAIGTDVVGTDRCRWY